MKKFKLSLSTITKMANGTPQERRFFSVLCHKMEQHSPFLKKIWSKPYRLVEIEHGRLGIYRDGGGYIVDPSNTLLFNDEVEAIYARL